VSVQTASKADRDWDLVTEVRGYFDAAKNHRRARVDDWQRNYRLVHNRSWGEHRPNWMPSPQVSETYPIVASMVGWMTDQRTGLSVIPAMNPHSPTYEFYSLLARDLELVLRSNWIVNKADIEVEKGLWDALIYGTGFWKVTWDQSRVGGLGDAVLSRVDPFRIYPDPAASNMEECNYIIEARTMSVQELERRWPGSKAKVEEGGYEESTVDERDPLHSGKGRAPMANPGGVNGAPPMWGRPGAGRTEASRELREDTAVTVYEAWLRENDHYTNDEGEVYVEDSWRVVVICGNEVLMDEPAKELWSHGKHPYIKYQMNEMGDFWGLALVDHLRPLQLAINRTLAAIQSNAELIGNPVLVEDARSGLPRTQIVNKPGQRVTKNSGSEVDWLKPPEMPNYIGELVKFYIGEMERVSGLSAIVRGATPTGRNAQGVLDSVQEAAFVRVRLALRNLEYALREAGELMAHLITENYTSPRLVSIVGPNGEKSSLALKARHFMVPTEEGAVPMRFQMWVQAGSSLPVSRQARAQEADVLFAMGAIDHQAVLEAHEYPNRHEILERIGLKAQIEQITGQPLGPGQPNARQATRGPTA
jgi:hypothetical protein